MIHLGDITKISGYTAPVVDVVVGGSPCQDLSVAGKRAGLDGERSGLFMEQIRIVKEMREKDEKSGRTGADIRPRFMLWENVPGAFSSNKAEDFRIVLEETARVADQNATIPAPPKWKWTTSGCIMGDGWSIAWRVCDAQFWGVPQRRRRIALVADFGGQSAPEILFVRKSVRGDSPSGRASREGTASPAENGVRGADRTIGGMILDDQGGSQMPTTGVVYSIQGNCVDRSDTAGCNGKGWTEDVSYTLNAFDVGDVRATDVVIAMDRAAFNQGANAQYDFEITESGVNSTLTTKGPSAVCYAIGNGQANESWLHEKVGSLNCMHDPQAVMVSSVDCRNGTEDTVNGALQSNAAHILNGNNAVRTRYIVRRLTPLECERLQGYPDRWTDIGDYIDSNGKKRQASDAVRYKALGNSIALPSWKWVLKRLSACYERDATMASLFDGIGGFPYLWEQLNGKGSCLWASEIEEFPMAVTKVRLT